MNAHKTINQTTTGIAPRQLVLFALLLLTVCCVQIRYPPLSYPAIGLFIAVIVAAMTLLLPMRAVTFARGSEVTLLRHPAFVPGFLFTAWYGCRWAIAGFPSTGASEVGTALWAACYFIIAVTLTPTSDSRQSGSSKLQLPPLLIFTLCITGLICGLHAFWQYHYSYAETYRELLASIGDRPPSRTELGILYHLKLRRVASVWGDPNALATFSAICLCASLELLLSAAGRFRTLLRVGAVFCAGACAIAIYYSGSRGGALDAIIVVAVYAAIWVQTRRNPTQRDRSAVAALVIAMAFVHLAGGSASGQATEKATQPAAAVSPAAGPSGWVWRSNTIRERLYYLQVGAKMIQMAPIAGLGPGSVDLYFGRLKPPEAREARHLHNWVVQTWAELGIVGLALLGWFLGAIAWKLLRMGLWRSSYDRALAVIFFIVIIDGLMQITWHQRELMALFALTCGIITARTGSRGAAPGVRRPVRVAGVIVVALMFLVAEIRFLKGESNKQIGYDAMYAGDLARAQDFLGRASAWIPRDPEPYAARASIALDQGRLSASQLLINKALQFGPESAAIHVQAAAIAEKLKRRDLVDNYLTKALRLYPSKPEYNYLYARHLLEERDLTNALKFAMLAVEYNFEPDSREKYENQVEQIKLMLDAKASNK